MKSASPFLPDAAATLEVTPEAVARWAHLPAGERPRLIDCRERDELDVCQIKGNEWHPLGTFPEADHLLENGGRGVVVYCHHGMRSLRGASFLRSRGVEKAFSMKGGIDAWSKLIDPAVPRY